MTLKVGDYLLTKHSNSQKYVFHCVMSQLCISFPQTCYFDVFVVFMAVWVFSIGRGSHPHRNFSVCKFNIFIENLEVWWPIFSLLANSNIFGWLVRQNGKTLPPPHPKSYLSDNWKRSIGTCDSLRKDCAVKSETLMTWNIHAL